MTRIALITFLLSGGFISLAQNQSNQNCFCCDEIYRQFDFWEGDWVVTSNANGKFAGSNTISKVESGCVLRENWTSANGTYSGTSLNFYDSKLQKWRQVWVDSQGQILELYGYFKNRQMILTSMPARDPNTGKEIYNRITWTHNADGTVRQLWEYTNDNWASITVLFDGLYQKSTNHIEK